MRKFAEVILFTVISTLLGFAISVPIFIFSVQEPVKINLWGIGELNIYKAAVIFVIIAMLIYFIIKNIIYKFKDDEETRKYILRKYPKGVSHLLIFFSQILPSFFPFWLRVIVVSGFIIYGIPNIIGFWFNNTILNSNKGTIANIVAGVVIIQLLFAPIIIILSLHSYFDRKRITEKDKTIEEENIQYNNYPISILIRRFIAGIIDFSLYVIIVIAFVSLFTYFSTLMPLKIDVDFMNYFAIPSIVFILINIIQLILLVRGGYTIGKLITRLRVKDNALNNLKSGQAIFREIILKSFAGFIYFSFIFIFFNKERLTLHDELLGTKVISL